MANRRRTSKPRFWLLLTLLFAVATVCGLGSQSRYLRMQNDKLAQLTQQHDALSAQKTELERELEFMETDEYIIRTARERLDMLMPGEILFEDAE